MIDGDHREESVRADFDAWRPHLVANAIVAFHDIDYVDVSTVVSRLFGPGRLAQVREIGNLAWFVALE